MVIANWMSTGPNQQLHSSMITKRSPPHLGASENGYPNHSLYNKLCDWEWDGPAGEARSCGGNVMMRISALKAAGGYRESLVAGEEPELCVRLRAGKWLIWRLDAMMAFHDAEMTRFGQWWTRSVRSGYAFAEGAYLHGAPPERHWVWESYRALILGGLVSDLMRHCQLGSLALGMACLVDLSVTNVPSDDSQSGRHQRPVIKGLF